MPSDMWICVQCKICKVRKRQKDGNTTNMRAHMNKCHAKEYAQFKISSVHSGMQSLDDSGVDDEENAASGSGSGSLQVLRGNESRVCQSTMSKSSKLKQQSLTQVGHLIIYHKFSCKLLFNNYAMPQKIYDMMCFV